MKQWIRRKKLEAKAAGNLCQCNILVFVGVCSACVWREIRMIASDPTATTDAISATSRDTNHAGFSTCRTTSPLRWQCGSAQNPSPLRVCPLLPFPSFFIDTIHSIRPDPSGATHGSPWTLRHISPNHVLKPCPSIAHLHAPLLSIFCACLSNALPLFLSPSIAP